MQGKKQNDVRIKELPNDYATRDAETLLGHQLVTPLVEWYKKNIATGHAAPSKMPTDSILSVPTIPENASDEIKGMMHNRNDIFQTSLYSIAQKVYAEDKDRLNATEDLLNLYGKSQINIGAVEINNRDMQQGGKYDYTHPDAYLSAVSFGAIEKRGDSLVSSTMPKNDAEELAALLKQELKLNDENCRVVQSRISTIGYRAIVNTDAVKQCLQELSEKTGVSGYERNPNGYSSYSIESPAPRAPHAEVVMRGDGYNLDAAQEDQSTGPKLTTFEFHISQSKDSLINIKLNTRALSSSTEIFGGWEEREINRSSGQNSNEKV